MNNKTRLPAFVLAVAVAAAGLAGCGNSTPAADPQQPAAAGETAIVLAADGVTVDGAPAGTESGAAVYLSSDIVYYEDRDTYDSGNLYGEGEADERHSAEEAAAHTVVNITQPGTYRLQGSLPQGQVRVDLGEKAADDPAAVVNLILDGVDLNCDVAPVILFRNVYECDNGWSTETATSEVDTTAAGANIIIADGSQNRVSGSHVARIYKDNADQKKLWKQDGAVYSYMSMNVNGGEAGSGLLDIYADNEGLDTELHLTINGGNINIRSQDDGINTNEDGVSVTTINGGNLHIIAGLGSEGDGIDSNGWLVINGGTVVSTAHPASDAGLDSDMGSFVNGGTVVALGSTMDWAESDSEQVTMNLQFAEYEDSGDAIVVTDQEGNVVFAYDPSEDEVLAENTRQYMGAVISCPAFELEQTYHVYIGGTLQGSEVAGIYDAATVAGFEGAVQQQYTGTDVRRGPGGMMGGPRPDGFEPGDRPTPPEGFADDRQPPEPPEGFEPGERPTPPEGFADDRQPPELPEGFEPEAQQGIADVAPSTEFYMQDKVNNFAGLTAAA